MAIRTATKQSEHDGAVRAAKQIYEQNSKHAWINPGSEKNKSWNGRYIDVIVAEDANATIAWVIEVETVDTVSDSEAREQWRDYDQAYQQRWFLAVPAGSAEEAERLVKNHGVTHCKVITWARNPNGSHTFWGLPGL